MVLLKFIFTDLSSVEALPQSYPCYMLRAIAVLDRTKEPGALGEPLYHGCYVQHSLTRLTENLLIVGGRYGLGSKDFNTYAQIMAVYENLKAA